MKITITPTTGKRAPSVFNLQDAAFGAGSVVTIEWEDERGNLHKKIVPVSHCHRPHVEHAENSPAVDEGLLVNILGKKKP